jgi:hypothetical protein
VTSLDFFSPDYATSRQRFREAAGRIDWTIEAFPIGQIGPYGEELTIDVAISPAAGASRAMVVSSGLHGVEGHFGSAVQLALLAGELVGQIVAAGIRAVLVHGLNPYGFAWSRRTNEDNIDLNRNFLLDGEPFTGGPPKYEALNGLLNPQKPPAVFDVFYFRAMHALARDGMPAVKQAVAGGQYEFPMGLFFGGKGHSRTLEALQDFLPRSLEGCHDVVHLDLHTGLGRWRSWKLLVDYPLSRHQRSRVIRWFGQTSFEENIIAGASRGGRKVAYETRGSIGRWLIAQYRKREYLALGAEFGTYGPLRVLAGLRAENQAHHWSAPDDVATRRAKKRLRELFCPSNASWRSDALKHGLALIEAVVNGEW